MRRLSEEKTRILFEKLSKYIGHNVKGLIERPDGLYAFRENRGRVYYGSQELFNSAMTFAPEEMHSCGICLGKFTKSNKFNLQITALACLAPYAQAKIWLKPAAEQQFLYGNNVAKSGLGRMSENIDRYQGVVIYSMSDLPLGFGVAAKSTMECKNAEPAAVIVFHQADIGEYVRSEDVLF
ncbi:60S ribosome subunit biogenesis protein NIP7 homolog [Harmonia axyridis]|uniref:60S ribosome subunit biogenesis protein NIP7 homolog n=1 Tax=Harmonia axyridis TaxID=115357 RepID=UPI001E2794A2|nr:60S ribosome subunit biogenesis protein NIP7 homolog [Harmonia axyridis]